LSIGFAEVGAISNQPEFVGGSLGEMGDGMGTEELGEVGGVEVGRALGGLVGSHTKNALGTIMDGGKEGRVRCNALTDERARGNDAFDGLLEGEASASVTGKSGRECKIVGVNGES
jgi:hypothetical protein